MARHTLILGFIGTVLTLNMNDAARAGYVVNVSQSGSDVVAVGAGTINTSGLIRGGELGGGSPQLAPASAIVVLGSLNFGAFAYYTEIVGPRTFGSGNGSSPGSGTGDTIGVIGTAAQQQLYLPLNYVSGSPLGSTVIWTGQSFSSIGLTTGTYVWTWGSGANADSFTMRIGTSAVPEPSSITMVGTGALGLIGHGLRRRKRS